jgi:CheY-like chemotaxis protein
MLGHELRNPLGAIVSAAAVLTRPGTPPDPAASRAGEIVTRQAQHLARLVDDLLDVSRLESGKVILQRQLLDLRDVVEAAVAALRAGAGARHRLDFAGVPAPVEADPTRLEQIALNLLDNAVKYTPPTGRVAVSVERAAGQAVLRVRDTGRGIARELLPAIFDAFTQAAPSLDRRTGGLGLGLTVVKRLVELHGGSISADSPGPGGGSEFVVRLPLARSEAVPGPPAAEPLSMPRPRHVVVVEDNADARDSLRLLLEMMGHRVETAGDGRAGLALLLGAKPDIAFIDVGLPGLDGYAVATTVRAEPAGRDLYLVALTGYGQAADRERALAAGFDAHVVKPADERALVRLLASAARRA